MSSTPSLPYSLTLLGWFIAISSCLCAPPAPAPSVPVPTDRQLAWHDIEQYAFIHFSLNTFTDKEWGYGDESPALFNPTDFDADQWARVISEAGLRGIVLTCKHHDGFCLWPSAFTEHSVKNSPWRNGKGDVVKEVSDACRKYGLRFGIYLSPWDRNRADYGSEAYITYYRQQLQELLTGYGEVFEVWMDGANGGSGFYGGANETRRIDNRVYYDWAATHALVRQLAPNAVLFSDAGPDARWCGNERGYIGEPNYNTLTLDTLYAGKAGIEALLNHGTADGAHWAGAEVDVSIRPGWFYHAKEDTLVRTPANLFKIYLESVGRGANLILNLPPDRRGLLHEQDVAALRAWKELKDQAFAVNLAEDADSYWHSSIATLQIAFPNSRQVSYIVLQEDIRLGQQVEAFTVEAQIGNQWKRIGKGTTIGHKRILPITPVETNALRITITEAEEYRALRNVEIY
jgi:alpha-L-fucosidase